MASRKKKIPDLFHEDGVDPVETATGYGRGVSQTNSPRRTDAAVKGGPSVGMIPKKKAGFYLSVELLERFTHKFHELKLAGFPIENKSALLEAALGFALDDIDKGKGSRVLKQLLRRA
jgi:hypothetical protein